MATHMTSRGEQPNRGPEPLGPADQPQGPIPATRGDPRSIIIVSVVGGLVLMVILVWIFLG